MSRVTAPVSKLTRSINSSAVSAAPHGSSHAVRNQGAVLSPKYAELLKNRRGHEQDSHARGLKTAHRPHPQPSLVGRPKPLMQTFTTTASPRIQRDASTIDYMVFPSSAVLSPPEADEVSTLRFPLLPDSFGVRHVVAETPDAPLAPPEISIVAADPTTVLPAAALTEVEGMGIDGVELRFAHDDDSGPAREPGMITDLWKGLMEDVFGEEAGKRKPAV